MIKLSQVVETKIKENSKKSLEEKKKLEEEKLKEEKEFVIQLRRQQRQEKIRYFLNISDLPSKWQEYTFENAEILCKEENKIHQKLKYYCKNFKKAKEKGLGLYLCGEVGTGKSFYSLCIFNELLSNYYKVYRTTLNGIYQRIQSTFSNFNNLTEEKVFKDLLNADLIILDDLGKENISETWGKSKLYTIFNFFYEKNKCIIISTNLGKREIADFMDTQGTDALLDRFRERLYTLEFVWSSRREKIGEKIFEEFWNRE
jgi:putative DNA replication protein